MKRIFKRLIIASCICAMLFSISGCVSTASTDDAKPLSAKSSYNIDEHEEESVKIDMGTGMAFSEKGSVRFEESSELVDFWEYGSKKSNTICFEGMKDDIFEFYTVQTTIEFAFEYKDMIYFLKKTYDKKKSEHSFTLYRTTLNGEDITKVSTVIAKDRDSEEDFFTEYYIYNVYVENNSLIFLMEYLNEDSYKYIDEIHKIDLKTGISKKLLEETEMTLADIKVDNDFTYLYLNSSLSKNPKVYKIDNNTNESSVIKYNFGDVRLPRIYAVYNDMLICMDNNADIIQVTVDNKPKIIYDGNYGEISYIWLLDNNIMINCNNSYFYSYNLETGKRKNYKDMSSDLSHAVYKLGDKYLCYIDEDAEDEYFDVIDSIWVYGGYECYYWSSVADVEANKHNFNKIKNQRNVYSTDTYPYDYNEYEYEYNYYEDDDEYDYEDDEVLYQ